MNHYVQNQNFASQESINHILFVQNLDNSFIKLLKNTSYSISQDIHGNLAIDQNIIEHRVVNQDYNPHQQAILLRIPVQSLKRYTFKIIEKRLSLEQQPNQLLVNGNPCSSHDLIHGDLVQLGNGLSIRYYTIPGTLDITTLQDLLQLSNGENWYETCLNIFNSFSASLPELASETINIGLSHLALIPDFSPELIIELGSDGELLYANATAFKQFPELLEQGKTHPLLSGIKIDWSLLSTQEITVKGDIFLRTIHCDRINKLIRVFARPLNQPSLKLKPSESAHLEEKVNQTLAQSLPNSIDLEYCIDCHRFQSTYDYLTKLPERSSAEVYLQTELFKESNKIVAFYLLDLDGFTHINEAFGYREGDQTLQALATRLKGALKENTFIGRWSGDEFVVILSASHLEHIHEIAQTLIDTFQSNIIVKQHEICVTTSIGIALAPQNAKDANTLIEKAYTALRQAKNKGKQCYQLYTDHASAKPEENLKEELKYALERDQLSIHYQPVVNPQTGSILSLEALLRWQHPQLGFIDPTKFIPLAEETGLIFSLGQWGLQTICLQYNRWQKMGLPKIPISINFSSRQLQQPDLRQKISQVLEKTQFKSHELIIEVNDSTIIEDLTHAPSLFWELCELGIRFSVDNFGGGHSSFSSLQKLPIYSLKTDPALIENILQEEAALRVLEAILTFSKSLKLQLVVKGVELKEQLGILRQLQCQAVQGDFLYAAMPSFQMTQVLQKHFQHTV
ncbi:MAG: EAL domain-containing protein [Cyanobacteria bacterium]|jgi:diguanylate cyclase (GGDEF)-like protein|nr:EAL domain-containing protein [Cyanobacteria bacterium GSL.Bin21]